MKKKISLLVLCGIVLIGVCGCGKEIKKEEQQTNNNSIGDYKYETTIKCDVLDNVKDTITDGNQYFILTNNNLVYLLSVDKLYSNDMNCKKISDIEMTMISSVNFIDNQGYEYYYSSDEKVLKKRYDIANRDYQQLHNDNIVRIAGISNNRQGIDFLLLDDNGIIYNGVQNEIGIKKSDTIYKQIENEKIKNFFIDNNPYGDEFIKYIITDKSFWENKEIITNEEECNKYADVKCQSTYEWVKNEEISNQINDFVIIMPSLLIKGNGDVFINEKVLNEF